MASVCDLGSDPLALNAGWRKNQQQPVMQPDGLIDLFMNLPAACHVVRRKPAADIIHLQISIKPLRKLLIFGRVADEARIELHGPVGKRFDEGNKVIRNSCATKKNFRYLPSGLVDRLDSDARRTAVKHGLKAYCGTQIVIQEQSSMDGSACKVGAAKVSRFEVCP